MSKPLGWDGWPKEHTAILREKWAECSASQIARMIGKTRNAVIGKANRLHLPPKRAGFRRNIRQHKPGPITLRDFEKSEA
jgi:hypothetical protein